MQAKLYLYLGGSWVDTEFDASPGLSYSGGMAGNKESDRIAKHGALNFVLNNNNDTYTPGSGTAHADWGKGTLVKVAFTNFATKVKFIGRVNSIKLQHAYNNNRAAITALDWMYFASQLPLDIPALQTSKRADQIITTIVGLSPVQPTSTDYQTGYSTFLYAFHDNTVKTTAYAEISKAVTSEWGYFYVKGDGTAVFEAYGGREATQKTVNIVTPAGGEILLEDGTALLLEDGTSALLEDYYAPTSTAAVAQAINGVEFEHGERIINRAVVQVYPYKPSTVDELVYTNEVNQEIPANGTVSFRVQFTDQNSRQPIAALAPTVKQYTLLHFDTPADGVTGIVDSADPRIAGSSTFFEATGGAYDTSVKKFGTASRSFNGSSDYILSPSQEKFNPRAGDFTIDWWEYRLASTSGAVAISRDIAGGYAPYVLGQSNGTINTCYITSTGSSWDIANGVTMGSLSVGSWAHFAITRSGTTFRTFKNGVQQASFTSSATILPTSSAYLSLFRHGSAYAYGYIDEFRIIKGYAQWTADFTPPVSQHEMSGVNWSVYTEPPKAGTEITSSMTVTVSTGGAGLDVTVASSSGSIGYLNFDVYATPLQSLSPISNIAEDSTSINEYGYFTENVDMRLRQGIVFAKTIADALVAAEKNPRTVLNKVSLIANKNDNNSALFMDCDLGDLVRVTESLSGYSELNHIQGVSWQAVPGNSGAIVYFDWILKEQ